MDESTLYCSQCNEIITAAELDDGLAVRIDGNLVCSMCVDSLPGEAQIQINRIRAVRGMAVTTYQVENKRHPKLKLYSFTNSANISDHRRKLVNDGYYDAPMLPLNEVGRKMMVDDEDVAVYQKKNIKPANRTPLFISAGAALVVIGGISILLTVNAPKHTNAAAHEQVAQNTPDNNVAPTSPAAKNTSVATPQSTTKTRYDYPVDSLEAYALTKQDPTCPKEVHEAIVQELIHKKDKQLDEADRALDEKRLDDVKKLADTLILPEDSVFRELQMREIDLRKRLHVSRQFLSAGPVIAVKTTTNTSNVPGKTEPDNINKLAEPKAQVIPGTIVLNAVDADLNGTYLRIETGNNTRTIAKWNRASDGANWTVAIPTAGNYRIEASIASATNTSVLAVEVADQMVSGPTPATGDWFGFQTVVLGTVTISQPGNVKVRARPINKESWNPLNLAELKFIPTTEAITSRQLAIAVIPQQPETDKAIDKAPEKAAVTALVTGRYVRIERPPNDYLSLAEVEVFSGGVNVAIKGKAKQVGTSNNGDASRAIDGKTDGNFHAGSTTHTNGGKNVQWWEVDLGKMLPIDTVTIWNRTDCCSDRLNNFSVIVLDGSRKEVARIDKTPTPKTSVQLEFNKVAVDPAVTQMWKGAFVSGVNKDAVNPLTQDGSENIPDQWPGGVDAFYRSEKVAPKNRHMLALDLTGHDVSEGGLVLMLHPMRHDRKQLLVNLSDATGKTVTLAPIEFSNNDWTTVRYLAKDIALDLTKLHQLTLEEDPSKSFISKDGGFLLVRLATTAYKEPQVGDLKLRATSLLHDEKWEKNLPKLLNMVAKFGKRKWQKSLDLSKVRILCAARFDQNWRNENKKGLLAEGLTSDDDLFSEIKFENSWFDNITKGEGRRPKPPIDVTKHQIVVLLTGGEEISMNADANKLLMEFWKKRLEQIIGLGVMPVVVIGPNFHSGDKHETMEKMWESLIDMITKQQLGIPIIDLRTVKPKAQSEITPHHYKLAGRMFGDGLQELYYKLRRVGGVK